MGDVERGVDGLHVSAARSAGADAGRRGRLSAVIGLRRGGGTVFIPDPGPAARLDKDGKNTNAEAEADADADQPVAVTPVAMVSVPSVSAPV